MPSPHTRRPIKTSPFDPTADLAGALRGVPDSRGLRVVSRPQISQRLQECALILRRAFPRPAPHRVTDHPRPVPPTISPSTSFVATRCDGRVFSCRPAFLFTWLQKRHSTGSSALLGKRHKAAISSRGLYSGDRRTGNETADKGSLTPGERTCRGQHDRVRPREDQPILNPSFRRTLKQLARRPVPLSALLTREARHIS